MVDNFYPYPEKYKFELDFYDIDYNDVKFYNPSSKNCIVDRCIHKAIDDSEVCSNHLKCFVRGCENIQTIYKGIKLKYCDRHIEVCGCGMFKCQGTLYYGCKICHECRNINKL